MQATQTPATHKQQHRKTATQTNIYIAIQQHTQTATLTPDLESQMRIDPSRLADTIKARVGCHLS